MTILLILAAFAAIYIFAICPRLSRREQLRPYEERYIAHRGLFNNEDIPENSLAAFRKAVENGYGIELDIQLTTDDRLVVFHDDTLQRMTGSEGILYEQDYATLQQLRLLDTDERIPLFTEVLAVLEKDTPLIIEIKPDGRYIETVKKVVELMKGYDGLYNIESFNPVVVRWLRKNEPQIIRGQLSYDYLKNSESTLSLPAKFIMTYLFMNFLTRPDYIAYECNSTGNLSFRIISRILHGRCVAWTIKSQEQLEKNSCWYSCFIFDSFIPKDRD